MTSVATPLDPTVVFARAGAAQFPQRTAAGLFFVQSLPEEGGRLVLKRLPPNEAAVTVTEPAFNIRSRVHEYGGCCHVLTDEHCLFVNFADQQLYQQPLAGGATLALTPQADTAVGHWMLADLDLHPSGRWLVAVGERSRSGQENENAIVLLDLAADEQRQWRVIAGGHDFYAAPRFAPDGDSLCLLHWDHPHMPWSNASLDEVRFDAGAGSLSDGEHVAGGVDSAACQASYCKDGTLVYALDNDGDAPWQGFWNLHRWHRGATEALTREQAEYGAAHWVFGHTRVRPIDEHRVLAVRTGESGDDLVLVHGGVFSSVHVDSDYIEFMHLSQLFDDEIQLVASSTGREPSILSVNIDSGRVTTLLHGESLMPADQITTARALRVPTRDGALTHAWHYRAPGKPPLMVLVHGGPTSRAGAAFDPLRQFWTTRGFAVLDVNHRGSTGHGRAYRQALDGFWGLRDVDDVIDAVRALIDDGEADPDRLFIRGGSAGGYAVLTALTRYPEVFAAGACYYGIGNLVTLARSTHKFEARYLDSLLGEVWDPALEGQADSVYVTRSPINAIDALRSPMILFQGSEDKVVPPEVSHEMVKALQDAGVMHQYVEYPGEGHGFRSAKNRVHALQAEAAFYEKVMAER